MKKVPKPIKLLVKIIMSCAFFSVLLTFVQGNELAEVLQQINWVYMIVTFVVTAVMVLASCAKWKLILNLKAQGLSFWELFKIYLVGYFFSNFLPSTVGGDVVRSYYAGNIIGNQSYAAVSVFVERFTGILFSFLLVTISPIFQPYLYKNPYVLVPSIGGLVFGLITLWICRAKNPFYLPNLIAEKFFSILYWTANKMGSGLLMRLGKRLEAFYGKIVGLMKKVREEMGIAVVAFKTDKSFLINLILLTVFFYALTWVNVYTSFLAFNVHVDFIKICAIVPAIMMVAYLPVTLLGNLGFVESVFVFYFLMVGVGGAETLAMGLLLRLKMLVMGLVGFATYLVYKQKNKLVLNKGS